VSVATQEYITQTSQKAMEKVANVAKGQGQGVVRLRDSWRNTFVAEGNTMCNKKLKLGTVLNVIGSFDCQGECIIDIENNFLVVNPDVLVSATTVADSLHCARKAVLKHQLSATSIVLTESEKPMLVGNILHQLLQTSMRTNAFSIRQLHKTSAAIFKSYAKALAFSEIDEFSVRSEVHSYFPKIVEWAEKYFSGKVTFVINFSTKLPKTTSQYQ
jgi:hypothetical protein